MCRHEWAIIEVDGERCASCGLNRPAWWWRARSLLRFAGIVLLLGAAVVGGNIAAAHIRALSPDATKEEPQP